MATATVKRIEQGCYDYRGYRVSESRDENGNVTGNWDVAEYVKHTNGPGGLDWGEWVVCAVYGNLWYCTEHIDSWLDSE
jgi:hypothetical protein